MPQKPDYITEPKLTVDSTVTMESIWQGDHVWEYPDFMTPEHVSDILHRLEADKHLRHPGVDIIDQKVTDQRDYGLWCMGQNFWSLPNHPEFDDVFDPDLRAYMAVRYSDINQLLENFCVNYLDRTPEYVPGIATPGFNMVTADLRGSWWHTDGALVRKLPDIDLDRIISITIPLQSDELSHTEFKITDTETYKLTHTPGNMLIWPGTKTHRFGCQPIINDYHRITYQAQIYDDLDRALIYY